MSIGQTSTIEDRLRELGEFVVATLHWKVFFVLVSFVSALISIKRDVSDQDRQFWLGVLALAAIVALVLLARDIWRWLGGSYLRDNAYQDNARLVGVGYELQEITASLKPDGSMKIRRRYHVKAFADRVDKLDYYMHAREAPDEGKEIIAQAVTDSVIPFAARREARVTIGFKTYEQSHDHWVGIVSFTPALVKGQETEFSFEEFLIPDSFAIIPERLKTGMDCEFFAWDITRPTKRLQLNVLLDSDTPVADASYEVWHGVTKMSHQHEYASIFGGWYDGSLDMPPKLTLGVKGPILNLSYIIKWRPAGKTDALPNAAQEPSKLAKP